MSEVLAAIDARARAKPLSPALRGARVELGWSDLRDAVHRAADAISAQPQWPGPVAVELDNGPAWVIVDLALMRLGLPSLPLPPFFTEDQRRAAIGDAGAAVRLRPASGRGGLSIAGQAIDLSPVVWRPRALPPGVAKITYTSGSTGKPKGVCLSMTQMEALASALVDTLGAEMAGTHLPILPLGVLLENVAGLYPTLLAGGVYHAAGPVETGLAHPFRPDFVKLAQAIAYTGASSLILVPELLRGLVAAKGALGLNLPRLKLVAVGGAKVSPQLLAAARGAGLPVVEGYGLSECASVVAMNRPGHSRDGSVGKPLPHLRVEIAHDGEVIVGPSPFLGYAGGPAQDGPVRTGDLGRFDADGFLHIDGRKSNLIINAFGRNISPEWVESELLAQPEIAQALAFGEAQPVLGALIVPTGFGGPDGVANAVARANARLPEYAQIKRWKTVAPFDPARGELTGNGRPRRAVLLAAHADFVSADFQETSCHSLQG